MFLRILKCFLILFVMLLNTLWGATVCAQRPTAGTSPSSQGLNGIVGTASLDIYVKGPNGNPVEGMAVVTLLQVTGQFYRQETTKAGLVRLHELAATEYIIQVGAPGYENAVKHFFTVAKEERAVTIELHPLSAEDAAAASGFSALAPKAQKEVGKALGALHANKAAEARTHLDAANRIAPNQAEVQYLYGVYSSQINNAAQAKSYWMKTVELNPRHLLALLSLAEALLHENRTAEALPYGNQAVEAEPSSWRAHALLAEADLLLGLADESVKQAERALELGHGQAAMVQTVLAEALGRSGEKGRAITILQDYLKEHPSDAAAKKLQEELQTASVMDVPAQPGTGAAGELPSVAGAATALPLPSNWLPSDVDEKMPPVEPGGACVLDEVLQKTGERIREFVKNVDRFTASEFLTHESINKWGLAGSPETRKFDYVVSVEEARPGSLNVEEYRRTGSSPSEFPDGISTNGLPALVLIFHPYLAGNFEMTCEGITHWNGGLAWQVHFRQRPDKPNTIKGFRVRADGPSYPVALKGRAWILADGFQIARLETDLVAPMPQIRLVADHTAIEYGPVSFRNRKVEMWLPKSAEVYFDWRGRRIHRRHSFSNYLLFAVDDKQRISLPKFDDNSPPKSQAEIKKMDP